MPLKANKPELSKPRGFRHLIDTRKLTRFSKINLLSIMKPKNFVTFVCQKYAFLMCVTVTVCWSKYILLQVFSQTRTTNSHAVKHWWSSETFWKKLWKICAYSKKSFWHWKSVSCILSECLYLDGGYQVFYVLFYVYCTYKVDEHVWKECDESLLHAVAGNLPL